MAGHALPSTSGRPVPTAPDLARQMPGWRCKSEPGAICTNVQRTNAQRHTWDDSQATLSSRCLSHFTNKSSELTQRVLEEVQDSLKVSLESFAAQQQRLLQDALASGLPSPRIDACMEIPLCMELPSSATSGGAVPHYSGENTEAQSPDLKPGFITGSSRSRRPSIDSQGTVKSHRCRKQLKRHHTLKDLENSLNNILIESQGTRKMTEESLEGKQRRNDADEITLKRYDSTGEQSMPKTSHSGIFRFMHGSFTPNAGFPHFNSVHPMDDTTSSAPTVHSHSSEGSTHGGCELTAWLRRAHERTLTAKLAEPEILLSGDDPLAVEAQCPRLSLCGIFFWLHLWGVLPWCFPGNGRGRPRVLAMHSNQVLILLVATLTVAFRIGEVVLVSPEVHTVGDMLLALGSFFCVFANWSVHRCNLFEEDQRFLLNYAKEHYFLRSWCWQSLWHLAEAILGWALTVASRAFVHSMEGGLDAAGTLRSLDMAAYSLTTGILFASTFCQLHCMNALACSVDRFSLRFTQDPSVSKRIQDWNSLQAMLRQASLAMEGCILVLLTTSMLMVFTCGVGSILDPAFGIVQSMLPVALLWATMGRLLLKCAHVTNRCNRVPSFVTALSAECEGAQLSERFLLVQFMESIAAGFYVSEIKLTSNAAMKLVYAGCMVMTTIFTAAVSGPSGLAAR